jgi:hypothetical protein
LKREEREEMAERREKREEDITFQVSRGETRRFQAN